MKLIKAEEAVGHVLCHDMTQIIKGVKMCIRDSGYICLPVSLIKGALGYVVVKYANRWVFRLLAILPQLLVHIVLLVLIGVLVVDVLASYLLVTGKSRQMCIRDSHWSMHLICFRLWDIFWCHVSKEEI